MSGIQQVNIDSNLAPVLGLRLPSRSLRVHRSQPPLARGLMVESDLREQEGRASRVYQANAD